MWSAGKQAVLTKFTPGYPLETCVLFCAVMREEMQAVIPAGSPQQISLCISVLMRGKPPGSSQSTPDALWVHCML